MKRFLALLLLAGGLLVAGGVNAAVTITLTETGGNVVATGVGRLDISQLGNPTPENVVGGFVNPSIGVLNTGPDAPTDIDLYSGISGPTSFGSGGPNTANSGTGDVMGVTIDLVTTVLLLRVPRNYSTGGSLSGSATWTNKTFASLGLTSGTYTYTWSGDSLTIQIGPAPAPAPAPIPTLSEWAQLLLTLMVLAMVGWHFHRERSY